MTSLDRYLALRDAFDADEVSYGYVRVRLLRADEVAAPQVGYRESEEGESFVGDAPGDLRESWWVVALENLVGDPIFIDTDEPELRVFTAAHGEGDWSPAPIAGSAEAFLNALRLVRELSAGRSNPVELERNPPDDDEVRAVVAAARRPAHRRGILDRVAEARGLKTAVSAGPGDGAGATRMSYLSAQ